MSHAKALDLSGINLGDIGRQTRAVRNFRVPTAPSGVTSSKPRIAVGGEGGGFPCRGLLIISIVVGSLYGVSTLFSGNKSVHSVKVAKSGNLRRMIRMDCQSRNMVTYCTTSYDGDYVVAIGGCDNVYEFNGIPFTELQKDTLGNYVIPGAVDNTLHIKDHCDEVVATVDTGQQTPDTLASTHGMRTAGNIEKLVWITEQCYKDFTVKIGDQTIYESTPVTMIKSVNMAKKVAYVYESDVDYLTGSITVLGTGCKSPIVKYVKRSV